MITRPRRLPIKKVRRPPSAKEVRRRYRFTFLTGIATVLLLGWGAFVTSIDAGLAVPDWPSSFNSYDPFNPWPRWWTLTPVLAEHGHRLLGMLVGALTLILAVWTWIADPRRWMKHLGVAALVLVSLQGTLGGLRVVLLSLDLAVVHACVAQIFLGLIVSMTLFTSITWLQPNDGTYDQATAPGTRKAALATLAILYGQIILGALLRHPGTGIDPALAGLHIFGACTASAAIIYLFRRIRLHHREARELLSTSRMLLGLLILQLALGITAYVVTLDDSGVLKPSNLQVTVNTAHMVVGALLMAASVATVLHAFRFEPPKAPRKRAGKDSSIIFSEPQPNR